MFELTIDDEICLRTLHPDDAETLFALLEKNRSRLKPWVHPSSLPETPRAARIYTIECYFASLDPLEAIDTPYIDEVRPYYPPVNPTMELGIWVCGELAGEISLSTLGSGDTGAEFGYWIGQEQEGKGIVTRCVRALMEYAVDHLKVDRFVIRCAKDNQRSRAVPERLGYDLVETIPDGEIIGEYVYDRLVYEISSEAWRGR
jgi:ribosomal-protein-serine acetyltransferase